MLRMVFLQLNNIKVIMENEYRFLEFEGVEIAAFMEVHNEREHSGYYANNILFYIQQGQLNIKYKHKLHTITKGGFCLVRKFTDLSYFKTWDEDEEGAIINAMVLQDEFVMDAIKELGLKIPTKVIRNPIMSLGENAILSGLYKSLMHYITEDQRPDKHLMFLKTKEAILGIVQSNPENLALFYEFYKPVKAELKEFMDHHNSSNISLPALAKLSGRSLSTFNRDFRKVYNTSPHKWLLKQRLHKAKEILLTTTRKSSEIYLELGFKDLAHFSRTFKREFDIPPSEINKI